MIVPGSMPSFYHSSIDNNKKLPEISKNGQKMCLTKSVSRYMYINRLYYYQSCLFVIVFVVS